MRLEYCDKNEVFGCEAYTIDIPAAMKMVNEYLIANGITRRDFAAHIGCAGSDVSKWLNGKMNPSAKTLDKFTKATGLDFSKCVVEKTPVEDVKEEFKPVKEVVEETPVEKCIKVKNLAGLRNKIRFGLQQKGVRQKDFAHILGLTETAYYKITHGNLDLPLDILEKMCEYLELGVEELVGEAVEDVVEAVDPNKEYNPEVFNDESDEENEDLGWEDKVKETIEEKVRKLDIPGFEEVDYKAISKPTGVNFHEFMTPPVEEMASEERDYNPPVEEIEEKPVEPRVNINYKPVNPNQRRVDELRKAAETIINNAESIVGSEISAGDLTVSIIFRHGEVPRVHVDRDIYF